MWNIVWNIELERNKRIFENIKRKPKICYHKIQYNVCFWTDTILKEGETITATQPPCRDPKSHLDLRPYPRNRMATPKEEGELVRESLTRVAI